MQICNVSPANAEFSPISLLCLKKIIPSINLCGLIINSLMLMIFCFNRELSKPCNLLLKYIAIINLSLNLLSTGWISEAFPQALLGKNCPAFIMSRRIHLVLKSTFMKWFHVTKLYYVTDRYVCITKPTQIDGIRTSVWYKLTPILSLVVLIALQYGNTKSLEIFRCIPSKYANYSMFSAQIVGNSSNSTAHPLFLFGFKGNGNDDQTEISPRVNHCKWDYRLPASKYIYYYYFAKEVFFLIVPFGLSLCIAISLIKHLMDKRKRIKTVNNHIILALIKDKSQLFSISNVVLDVNNIKAQIPVCKPFKSDTTMKRNVDRVDVARVFPKITTGDALIDVVTECPANQSPSPSNITKISGKNANNYDVTVGSVKNKADGVIDPNAGSKCSLGIQEEDRIKRLQSFSDRKSVWDKAIDKSIMLFVVILLSMVLTTPYKVSKLKFFLTLKGHSNNKALLKKVSPLMLLLEYASYSLFFVTYTLLDSNFKREVYSMCKKLIGYKSNIITNAL